MAIHQEQVQEVQGFKKEIEESAMGMILDNLQVSQYQYPQKSTVRELVSNALDAVREKAIAISILNGKSKVEEHFITRDDPMFKDSNFDPTYYDLKWLWHEQPANTFGNTATLWGKDSQTVYVTYEDGGEREKDKLIIEDFGVGLGANRIEGYFKLGFSTKRNTKTALGKFGIGAKAALSTAPFYTMTSRYNGREYCFQIYSHTITPIVPQYDLETGKENGAHIFKNGAVIYYKETTAPNGTTIEVDAKKHHKQLYIDAVKSQLLYFDNVEFRVKNPSGGMDIVPIKAEILFENDLIVMSDNNQYSKPHLLINKVNYGYVDFRELELEDLMGNIGIKVAAEEVSVNPSRESVIWNETTRETVVARFKEVVAIAGNMITEQLKVNDIIEWIKACSEITAKFANSNSIIGRLSRIVDLNRVRVRFNRDPSIGFDADIIRLLDIRLVRLDEKREGSTVKYHIKREAIGFQDIATGKPIIVMSTGSSFAKDKYLLQQVYPGGFIAIRLRHQQMNEEGEATENLEGITSAMHDMYLQIVKESREKNYERYETTLEELHTKATSIERFILESACVIPYDSVVVPENYDTSEEIIEEEVEVAKEVKMSLAARRKLTGSMPIYTPRVTYQIGTTTPGFNTGRIYEWQKLELTAADIDSWEEQEIFFATDKVIGQENGRDVLESELLHLAACITRPEDDKLGTLEEVTDPMTDRISGYNAAERCTHFFNTSVKLIKIAQERRKYFMDFKPIQRFFMDIKNKTLTMSNALIRWNTARVMHEHFGKLKFLENFELFHYANCQNYRFLKSYVETNYREVGSIAKGDNYYGMKEKSYEDLINHCDKVMKLQLLVREHSANPELIAVAVKEMFNPQQEIIDGCAVDVALYDQLMKLVEYAAPIHTLLNELYVLTNTGRRDISERLEHDIKEYLTFKGVEIA